MDITPEASFARSHANNQKAYRERHKHDPKYKAKKRVASRRFYAKHRDRLLASTRRKNAESPERIWAKDIKYKFGVTVEQYNEFLLKQDGKCAICQGEQVNGRKRLDVDHCHKTGKVRGLLCGFCNRAVGLLKDDLVLVTKLSNYLRG